MEVRYRNFPSPGKQAKCLNKRPVSVQLIETRMLRVHAYQVDRIRRDVDDPV